MLNPPLKIIWPALLSVGILVRSVINLPAQPFAPTDVGTVVNGFQDDFNGTSLGSNWVVRGNSVFSVNGGMLHVTTANGDPNHVLYELPNYNNSVQEVLARIRVFNFGTGDQPRAGVGVCVDPLTSQGINSLFRDNTSEGQSGRHTAFLDDTRTWGPGQSFVWQNNSWYWMRLRHEPNAAAQGGVNDVFGKVWLADGSTREPAGWQLVWDYTPVASPRAGYAGITAGSNNGTSQFDVDYLLIKASGLPSILVSPSASVQTPVTITSQPQDQTILELSSVTFSVGVSANPQPTYQWYQNDLAIGSATNATYTLPITPLTNNGALFYVIAANVVTNVPYSVTSSVVTLTVVADTNPPTLMRARSLGLGQVQVAFSEKVVLATATNLANYTLTSTNGSLTISNATLDASQTNVVLTVSPMTDGLAYTLTVNGITDRSAAANTIPPNSQATFIAVSYFPQDIGNPTTPGSIISAPGGYTVTAGGTDIGGVSDQFSFAYQARSGDFDLKVRVASLSPSDAWAKAGLMARETLTPGSRCAAVLATPAVSGSFFLYRTTAGTAAAINGNFPLNYPYTWLRLQRAGSTFNGYASWDGQNWTLLGTTVIALPATIYLGMAASSHTSSQGTTVQFQDLGNVAGGTVSSVPLPREPLGPSSRKTGLVFSEIMYHPNPRPGVTNSLEFIELYNSQAIWEKIGGYSLSGDISYTFPSNTVIQAGGFLVLARDPVFLQSYYGLDASVIVGPWVGAATNNLPNNQGTVRLHNRQGAVLLEVAYDTAPPWPIAADGTGHSLVLARPSYGEGDPRAWAASDLLGGSPGSLDPTGPESLRPVMINEFLAHTNDPSQQFVELYNHSKQALDLSGAYLSDIPNTNKFRIPDGTVIPPRSFVAFPQSALGFVLSAGGGRIYLVNSNQTRVIDAVLYEGQANGVACGRFPDGAPVFRELAAPTPNAANSGVLGRDIVINEIMYNPISGDANDEYLELYNRGTTMVSLGNWKFTAGINFTFPTNTLLPPNGYLVVAKNMANLLAHYPNLNTGNTVGDYGATLANGGERIALAMPDTAITYITNGGLLTAVTNVIYVVENEVTYGKGGRWGVWSDGGGSSLELLDPRSDNRRAANWADSDETAKSAWTNFEFTGSIDNYDGTEGANDEIQFGLLDSGECLLDDIEVRNAAYVNILVNGNFEAGTNNWVFQGDHDQSFIENTNYPGSPGTKCLHLRASARMDTGANRVRSKSPFTQALSGSATLRAKGRWLRGWPEVLLRLHGNGLEAFGRLPLPTNLGTPGARNSRAVTNVGPALFDVLHSPPLPAVNQPIVVTASVDDPNGIASLVVRYRVDPAATLASVRMVDDGTGGDDIAGDGVYSATIPGQASGTMVAFHLMAVDALGTTNLFPKDALTRVFPMDADTRECLVRWGEPQPPGSFGTYHTFITSANNTRWTSRDQLNNAPLDATFVYNNSRVIYNMGPHYKGSPWHIGQMQGPTNPSRVDFLYEFPSDDPFLGSATFALSTVGNPSGTTSSDPSGQSEQTSYIIFKEIGLHYNYRRYVHVFINGDRRSSTSNLNPSTFVMEDSQFPDGETVGEWYPNDPNGQLYKIEDWFEFDDTGTVQHNNDATLQRFSTTFGGVTSLKVARYRHSWRKRAVALQQSANDFTNIAAVVDALSPVSNPASSTIANVAALDAVINIEQWMRIVAVQHTVGNWDSYGYNRGKNCYTYKGEQGRFELMTWDIDFTMGVGGDGAGTSLFSTVEPRFTAMWNTPAIVRAYWRAYQDIVNGPLNNLFLDPILDAKAAAFAANGVNYDPPTLGLIKTFVSARRNFILSQLASVAANFSVAGPNNLTVSSNIVSLSGTAPITIKTITVNGSPWPVTWTGANNWTLSFPVSAGTNQFTVLGYDVHGNPVAGASNALTVVYSGNIPSPQNAVVINEIMFNPLTPNGEYVELFNTSSNVTFDLSGWRFNGLAYTFPAGSYIGPRSFLVLAKDPAGFLEGYGASVPVFDYFTGNVQSNGETLTLIKPGQTPAQDLIINRVRYEPVAPWPLGTNGMTTASSIQLLDPTQDNSRPCNWATRYSPAVWSSAVYTPAITNVSWRFTSFTGIPGGTRLLLYLGTAGDVYLDDVSLVAGTVPGQGPNLIVNGDFEAPLSNTWSFFSAAVTNTTPSSAEKHSGNSSLHLVFTGAGGQTANVYQDLPGIVTSNTYTLSFWYLTSVRATYLTFRLSSSFVFSTNVQPPITPATYTPPQLLSPANVAVTPATNNTWATNLPPIPPLWLNEIQPVNVNGITNNAGAHAPWIELYNAGTQPVPLDGLYLADNYTNLTQWAFPAGIVLSPGEFKVIFADSNSSMSTPAELHTSFRLGEDSGSVALSRIQTGLPAVLDYINYRSVPTDYSYGSVPEGQPFVRKMMYHATPGGTNNGASAPVFVRINEWMASNTRTIVDAATGKHEDWFELYNPNESAVDLTGWSLANSLTNVTQFLVPSGYLIPAHGFLLVWADGKPGQNSTNEFDLHVSFKLNKAGETIALYAPDRRLVDAITFGSQTNDVSMGRCSDGGTNVLFMTTPTPRTFNVCPMNTPPQWLPMADQTVWAGQTLAFNLTAQDTDWPPQQLTFSLGPGAPGDAVLNPTNGYFSWTPATAPVLGTNTIRVHVADNGSPPLSTEGSFVIVVLTSNRPPMLASISDLYTGPLKRLMFTNTAADPDGHRLSYSLGAGAPAGARLNPTNGVFAWTPSRAQAPSTNVLIVQVSDEGMPPLTDRQIFRIIVGHYVELSVGSTVLQAGESDTLALEVYASADWTNLSFALKPSTPNLTDVTVQPAANLSGALQARPEGGWNLAFVPAGQTLQGTQHLGQLEFLAQSNLPSAMAYLRLSEVIAAGPSQVVTNALLHDGRVVVIGEEPLLEVAAGSPPLGTMTLYGKPGTDYSVESANGSSGISNWQFLFPLHLDGMYQVIPAIPLTNQVLLFRAYVPRKQP